MSTASEAARQILEALMSTSPFKSDFIEGFVQEGLAEGLAQGLERGLARGMTQGLARGRAEAKAEDIIKILNSRGLPPDDQQREQLSACADLDLLDRWFDRALVATSVDDVFAAPAELEDRGF
jgi:flagellar biosynthesis/type III secretory pathway protein FliH